MKALLLALVVFMTASVSSAAFLMSKNIRGCSFWSYSNEARGYVCSSPDMSISVPEAYDVQRYLTQLELQNAELLRRVQALEAKVP